MTYQKPLPQPALRRAATAAAASPLTATSTATATAAATASSRRGRDPQFSLKEALGSPAFTPRRGDIDPILELFAQEAVSEAVVAQALLRIGPSAFAHLLLQLQRSPVRGTARAARVRLLGRLARVDDPAELQALLALTQDPDPPAARNAIAVLGRLLVPADSAAVHTIEPALLALWSERPQPVDRRALAEALGKLGGAAALTRLRAALQEGPSDPLLRQVLERAVLRLSRTALRPAASGPLAAPPIAAAVMLPRPMDVTLLCRAGLTQVLADELRACGLTAPRAPLAIEESERIGEPGRVTLRWTRSLSELLAVRTCTELALPLAGPTAAVPATPPANDEALIAAVTSALTSEATVLAMRTLSRGPLRYRVHFTEMGHRRALVFRIAAAVASRCPELCNDPTDSPWELRIGGGSGATSPLRLELVPRQLADPRFAYRLGDVPAASHPTLAAALARLCAARPGDVVWDPFVGSGSELIEVALLARQHGAERTISCFGSDLVDAALATAAQNAAAAHVELTLRQGDALAAPPPGLTRIVTNPPMGRRVQRGEATELLSHFAEHAARVLPRGGQLTFIAPQPQRTGPILQAGGLTLKTAHAIDMNGFWARIEVWNKP